MSHSNPLVPCPDCARHVRALESKCPFCGGALPTNGQLASRAVPSTTQRLSRGAAFVFASSLAMSACGPTTTGGGDAASEAGGGNDGAPSDTGGPRDDGSIVAMYGEPAPVDAGDAARADANPTDDGGGPIAAYGGPAPVDAGPDVSVNDAAATDGGPNDDGGSASLYGLAPPPDAGDGGGGLRYGAPPPPDGYWV